jgi:hypothetical protein
MLLRDELLFIASVLRSGDAGAHAQIVASRRLVRIADDIHRIEHAPRRRWSGTRTSRSICWP